MSFHYSHFTQTISHFRDDQQIQEPVWKQCDLLGPVWCVQPAEAGPPHSLHIKSLYCSDCPPFFGNSSGAAPPEGGEVWLDASFIALSCFTRSPDAPRPSDTVISWMHPKPERGKLFLFIPLNSFFFFLRFYYKQPSFHGWTSLVQTVVLCLVQILFACQDAVPHLPWRKCCGRAEKKESFEALCKLYTLSLFCSVLVQVDHQCSYCVLSLWKFNPCYAALWTPVLLWGSITFTKQLLNGPGAFFFFLI